MSWAPATLMFAGIGVTLLVVGQLWLGLGVLVVALLTGIGVVVDWRDP